ncbi:hypothetical protein [Paludifilum halophilum]|nr:hypothetical protein [Paludifilum halophilum]
MSKNVSSLWWDQLLDDAYVFLNIVGTLVVLGLVIDPSRLRRRKTD